MSGGDRATISIGDGLPRIDGRLKVTGAALYAGDVTAAGTLHAAIVPSLIANGRVVSVSDRAARAEPGVVAIFWHDNFTKLQDAGFLLLLQNDRVWHAGQPLALVVADTAEHARRAAARLDIDYDEQPPVVALGAWGDDPSEQHTPSVVVGSTPDSVRGDPQDGLRQAAVRINEQYTTPTHNHSPLEPHVALAQPEGDRLTVYATTQAVFAARAALAAGLGIPPSQVRVISRFLGGGFCSKGRGWFPLLLVVAAAARRLGVPVRLELRREEMFTAVANRQRTRHAIALGASARGKLTAITHDVVAHTSAFDDYSDPNAFPSRVLYACPNVATSHRVVRVNLPHPVPMRAPGEGPGSFALESAVDEIAYALRMDPLEFRERNFANVDQHANKPWSSNGLQECYRIAARAFGWSERPLEPRMLPDGALLRGWGMASAYYPVYQVDARATVSMRPDGSVVARCGAHDVGTGTYTVIAQIVASILRVPIDRVEVELGDTSLPEGPPAFGSMSAASFTPAVIRAAEALRARLADPNGLPPEATVEAQGHAQRTERSDAFSSQAYGAVFAEVAVDEALGQVRVSRLVAAYAAGRILNARTARSQYIGGLVFGVGMALHEETRFDPTLARVMNGTLADYLVPVHADIPDIDVHLVDEVDEDLESAGVKGIGMLGTVGTAAAIANAVFHATGRRIRDLPIRMEQFLA